MRFVRPEEAKAVAEEKEDRPKSTVIVKSNECIIPRIQMLLKTLNFDRNHFLKFSGQLIVCLRTVPECDLDCAGMLLYQMASDLDVISCYVR